jgi:hypothetical protein
MLEDFVKPGVLSITIKDSKIVGLAPFKKKQWDRLIHLNFIDTPLLSCDAIAELKRPGLRILSECVCDINPTSTTTTTTAPTPPKDDGRTVCLAFIIVIIAAMALALSSLLYMVWRPINSEPEGDLPYMVRLSTEPEEAMPRRETRV